MFYSLPSKSAANKSPTLSQFMCLLEAMEGSRGAGGSEVPSWEPGTNTLRGTGRKAQEGSNTEGREAIPEQGKQFQSKGRSIQGHPQRHGPAEPWAGTELPGPTCAAVALNSILGQPGTRSCRLGFPSFPSFPWPGGVGEAFMERGVLCKQRQGQAGGAWSSLGSWEASLPTAAVALGGLWGPPNPTQPGILK